LHNCTNTKINTCNPNVVMSIIRPKRNDVCTSSVYIVDIIKGTAKGMKGIFYVSNVKIEFLEDLVVYTNIFAKTVSTYDPMTLTYKKLIPGSNFKVYRGSLVILNGFEIVRCNFIDNNITNYLKGFWSNNLQQISSDYNTYYTIDASYNLTKWILTYDK